MTLPEDYIVVSNKASYKPRKFHVVFGGINNNFYNNKVILLSGKDEKDIYRRCSTLYNINNIRIKEVYGY